MKGEAAMVKGENDKALKFFDKALGLLGPAGEGYEDDAAKTHVEDDIGLVGEAVLLQKQGEAQYAANEYDRAIDSFTKALAIEPDSQELKDWLKKAQDAKAPWDQANGLASHRRLSHEVITLIQTRVIPHVIVCIFEHV